jgi:sugar lactone lactonase YvrE
VIQSGRKCNAGDICTAGQDTCRAYTNLDSPDGRFCVRTDGDTCGSNQMCLSYRCAQRRCGLYDAGPQISVAAIWGGKGGGGNDGEPPQFTFAVDVHVDGQGNVFVPNAGGFPGNQHRVLELSPEGLRLAAWGEKGNGGADGSSPKFNQPYSVTTDSSGNIYVADRENHRVQKLDPQGIRLAAWGASGSGGSTGGSPQFDSPQGVAVDADGNVYIADTLNHRIQKLDPDGNVLAAWGNRGSGGSPGGAPKFDEPYSVALDSLGYVYVADFRNSRVQKLDVDGTVLAVWGSSGTGVVVGTAPKFRAPRDVVVDGDGNVYVADTGNHRIQKLNPDGMVLAAWGTRGGGGEVGGQPELDSPYGVAIDGAGSVYVADQGNDRIQKLDFLF